MGTAFRLGSGSIIGKQRLFKKVIGSITVPELIRQGYLTKPIAPAAAGHYDFSGVKTIGGKYKEVDLQSAVADARLTKTIIADVIAQTAGRNKVLLFASTLRHATEIIGYLPEGAAGYWTAHYRKKSVSASYGPLVRAL
jgi:DNA repair protein RadD